MFWEVGSSGRALSLVSDVGVHSAPGLKPCPGIGLVRVSEGDFGYDVNARNQVIALSDDWASLAKSGSASGLTRDEIVGRSIRDFISGKETRYLYEFLFEKVRTRGQAVEFSFRCDSPNCRRFMSLALSPLDQGSLRLAGRTLRLEYRTAVQLLDRAAARPKNFLTICSWCKGIRLSPNRWVEVEVALRELGLFQESLLPSLTHGICTHCESRIETF